MIEKTSQISAEQLLGMPADGNRYELLDGVLNMMSPAGGEHGRIAARISARLQMHAENNELGETFAAETGFKIRQNPDTVRAPDAAFVSKERMSSIAVTTGYLPLAPDLVIEVVSPSDSFTDVEAKAQQWLAAGTLVVLVAEPATETLRIYKDQSQIQILKSGDTFDSGNVCGNWKLTVDESFGIKKNG